MRHEGPFLTKRPRRDLEHFSVGVERGYYLTIQEPEEKQKQDPENVRKVFDISNLKRDEHGCGKHDRCHSKTIGIAQLSSVVEGGDDNNGRYHN